MTTHESTRDTERKHIHSEIFLLRSQYGQDFKKQITSTIDRLKGYCTAEDRKQIAAFWIAYYFPIIIDDPDDSINLLRGHFGVTQDLLTIGALESELFKFQKIKDKNRHPGDMQRELELLEALVGLYEKYYSATSSDEKKAFISERMIPVKMRLVDVAKLNSLAPRTDQSIKQEKSKHKPLFFLTKKQSRKALKTSPFSKFSSIVRVEEIDSLKQCFETKKRKVLFLTTKTTVELNFDKLDQWLEGFVDKVVKKEKSLFPNKNIDPNKKVELAVDELQKLLQSMADKQLIELWKKFCCDSSKNFYSALTYYKFKPEGYSIPDSMNSEDELSLGVSNVFEKLMIPLSALEYVMQKRGLIGKNEGFSIDKNITQEKINSKAKTELDNLVMNFNKKNAVEVLMHNMRASGLIA